MEVIPWFLKWSHKGTSFNSVKTRIHDAISFNTRFKVERHVDTRN